MRASRVAALSLAIAGFGLAAVPAGAAVVSWGKPIGGSFDDPNLWNQGTVPTQIDSVVFNASGPQPYTVRFPGNVSTAQLLVGNDRVTMDLASARYSVTSNLPYSVDISVVRNASAAVAFANGTVNSGGAYIGHVSHSWGNVKVQNSTWNSSSTIYVGAAGWGGLLISDGGKVNSVSGGIGRGGLAGTVALNGEGATWNITQGLLVGTNRPGTGVLQVLQGGDLSIGQTMDIRAGGSVSLDGGQMDVGSILKGGSFTFKSGTLNINSSDVLVDTAGLFGKSLALNAQQALSVAQTLTVASGAQLSLSDTQFSAGQTINKGLISLAGANPVIGGQSLNNFGRVSGAGQIQSSVNNQASATIDVPAGKQLSFAASATNSGQLLVGAGATASFTGPVVQSGTVALGDSGQAVFNGNVSGAGGFTGNGTVTFNGVYSPGNGNTTVSFDGDVVFGPDAHLQLDLGGAQVYASRAVNSAAVVPAADYDQLQAGHSVTLSNVDVAFTSGFQPNVGDVFDVVTAPSITYGDNFHVSLPTLDGSSQWTYFATPTALQLAVVAVQVPEPSTLLLVGAAGAAALLGRRRRKA